MPCALRVRLGVTGSDWGVKKKKKWREREWAVFPPFHPVGIRTPAQSTHYQGPNYLSVGNKDDTTGVL